MLLCAALGCDSATDEPPVDVVDAGMLDAGADVLDAGAGAPYPGYTLFAPMASTDTFLIDEAGDMVHRWPSAYRPGLAVYLLEDGSLLRTENSLPMGTPNRFDAGGAAGRIERIDWDGNVVWSFDLLSDEMRTHHDIEPLPNGNLLAIAWEAISEDEAESLGRATDRVDSVGLFSEVVLEIEPTGAEGGNIVWEWHARDHFGSGRFRIDVNGGPSGSDFIHLNSVDYDAELDQILLSSHGFSEIWVVDHSTTTASAATSVGGDRGHGGDLLYRWGNPASYGGGTAADARFFAQHDARWVARPDGGRSVTVFNNGLRRPEGNYSSVDEIVLPLDSSGDYAFAGTSYEPVALASSYVADDPTSFYAQNISGAERLPNGNTLICAGTTGVIFEISSSFATVFRYEMPAFGATPAASLVFRATRYGVDYPAFAGRSLTSMGPVIP